MSGIGKNIQWFILGAVTTIGFITVVVGLVFYFFFPFIKFDESTGRLRVLGGVIDIQAKTVMAQMTKDSTFVFGSMEGVQKLSSSTKALAIKFDSGEVHIDYNSSAELNWDCDGTGKGARVVEDSASGEAILDLSGTFVDCDISVPHLKLNVDGQNGEIVIKNIQSTLDVRLVSGEVRLGFVDSQKYKLDLGVESGEISSSFDTLRNKEGIPVSVQVKMGQIGLLK